MVNLDPRWSNRDYSDFSEWCRENGGKARDMNGDRVGRMCEFDHGQISLFDGKYGEQGMSVVAATDREVRANEVRGSSPPERSTARPGDTVEAKWEGSTVTLDGRVVKIDGYKAGYVDDRGDIRLDMSKGSKRIAEILRESNRLTR